MLIQPQNFRTNWAHHAYLMPSSLNTILSWRSFETLKSFQKTSTSNFVYIINHRSAFFNLTGIKTRLMSSMIPPNFGIETHSEWRVDKMRWWCVEREDANPDAFTVRLAGGVNVFGELEYQCSLYILSFAVSTSSFAYIIEGTLLGI